MSYDEIVQRLYLRQIVTETKDLADWVVQQVYHTPAQEDTPTGTHDDDDSDDDIFGRLARQVSACPYTRDEGGKIGWVEAKEDYQVLPADVIAQVYERQPKPGDLLVVGPSHAKSQWHCIQVVEAWMQPLLADRRYEGGRVGEHEGINAVLPRPKLKGAGVMPSLPSNMKTYMIQTAGCQMNVADSERLAGVLENQLNLKPAAKASEADLILLNTCRYVGRREEKAQICTSLPFCILPSFCIFHSIRDHAEQKLYDALGPFAAQKRKGKDLALIVTGCVAQQEGEALLRRVPEIDVVLGPQYVPYLSNVLDRVKDGHQVVATAPMLVQEDLSKPIRGHDVRAWVNVIYGCNEHCTYCVVPATRGMEQSRTMEAILQECLDLAKDGFSEINLLGQNIDACTSTTEQPSFTLIISQPYCYSNLPRRRPRHGTKAQLCRFTRILECQAA